MPRSFRKAYLGSSTKKLDIFRQLSKNLLDGETVKSLPLFVVRMTAAADWRDAAAAAAEATAWWPEALEAKLRNNTLDIIF